MSLLKIRSLDLKKKEPSEKQDIHLYPKRNYIVLS
jgi:hypothetical protein